MSSQKIIEDFVTLLVRSSESEKCTEEEPVKAFLKQIGSPLMRDTTFLDLMTLFTNCREFEDASLETMTLPLPKLGNYHPDFSKSNVPLERILKFMPHVEEITVAVWQLLWLKEDVSYPEITSITVVAGECRDVSPIDLVCLKRFPNLKSFNASDAKHVFLWNDASCFPSSLETLELYRVRAHKMYLGRLTSLKSLKISLEIGCVIDLVGRQDFVCIDLKHCKGDSSLHAKFCEKLIILGTNQNAYIAVHFPVDVPRGMICMEELVMVK